jgi:hypothetical protein
MSTRAVLRAAIVSAFAAAPFVVINSNQALAASGDRIGDAVVITNLVMADFSDKQRKLLKGDDVRQDETIEVNTDAQGEFRLDDDTKLALGPGSRLVLDKFVYDSDKKAGSIIVNFAKGAFRFITGVAAKPTYVINTPNASITVRGTIFDTYILPDHSTWLLLHEGAIEATGKKNVCRVLDVPGQMIRISPDGEVGKPQNWSQLPDKNSVAFDTAFPFVINMPAVDPTQRLTRAEIVNAAFPPSPDQTCVNPHAPGEIRKAEPGPRKPPQKAKKKQVVTREKPRTKYHPKNDPDDWGNGMTGMGIVIGGGLGGFGRHHGSGYPTGGYGRGR